MSAAGGLGFGLVMGWLAGRIGVGSDRTAETIPAVSAGLLVVAAADGLLAGPTAVGGYLGAVIIAAGGSITWWRWLESRAALSS